MKFRQVVAIFIWTSSLSAQDQVKNKIADLWWNGEIEVFNNRNKKLDYDNAIYVIRNQNVSTNCWSNFYRYTQNMLQPNDEQVAFYPLKDCKIIKDSSNIFNVMSTTDSNTGEERIEKLFTYKVKEPKNNKCVSNIRLGKFLNKELKISRVLFKNSLNQLVDDCHKKYSIQLNRDGTFKQSFENQVNCKCEINPKEFQKIHQIGFAKFDEANHKLLGLSGIWKTESDKLYLKFSSGNIFKYHYEIRDLEVILSDELTTIELKEPIQNSQR